MLSLSLIFFPTSNHGIPIIDQEPPTKTQVEEVVAFINQMKAKHKAVYLHCHAGVGRTGTMAHAIYIFQGMKLDDVKQKIKTTRPTSQFLMLSDVQKSFLEALAKKLGQ